MLASVQPLAGLVIKG